MVDTIMERFVDGLIVIGIFAGQAATVLAGF